MEKTIGAVLFFFAVAFSCGAVYGQTGSAARSFAWVGSSYDQFTQDQFKRLAEDNSIVVLAKFHALWNIEKHYEAALELKKRNPSLKVLIYYAPGMWFPRNGYGQGAFREAWYLHDGSGGRVPFNNGAAFYTDMTNSEYRNWAVSLIKNWLAMTSPTGAPLFDGAALDNTFVFNVYQPSGIGSQQVQGMLNAVGETKLKAWNDGMLAFVGQVKSAVGNKLVIFNGLADKPWLYGRELQLMPSADGALNEAFGYVYDKPASNQSILADIALMKQESGAGKIVLEKTNVGNSAGLNENQKRRIKRFSYGIFLLGHEPGFTFFKYADEPLYATEGNIGTETPELKLDPGSPQGDYSRVSPQAVYVRWFEKTIVYVNMENTSQSVRVPVKATSMVGSVSGTTYNAGDTLDIPARDAVFLVKD